jgi:hypothetical protein
VEHRCQVLDRKSQLDGESQLRNHLAGVAQA